MMDVCVQHPSMVVVEACGKVELIQWAYLMALVVSIKDGLQMI